MRTDQISKTPMTLMGRLRAALAVGLLLVAGPAVALEATHGTTVEAKGPRTDMVFLSGQDVLVGVASTDDVMVTGKSIRVDQATADHLFAAGTTITFAGSDIHDIFAAGKELSFETGQTRDDVVAFGETLTFRPTFKITGSAVLGGRNVTLQAPVGGDVTAGGQEVRIDSAITGNVKVEGQHVVIGPNARIGGNLAYRGDKVEISPQAVIAGQKTILPARVHHRMHHGVRGPATMAEQISDKLFGVLIFGVLALGMAALFPGLMERSGRMVSGNPLIAGVAGIGVLILGPAVALVLLITIIGAPLAATVIAILGIVAATAMAATAAGLGLLARGLTGKGSGALTLAGQLGWTLLGVVVLCALGAIPYAGGWLMLIAFVLGAGAVAVQGRSALAARA
jgi:hypothetical protein